MATYRKPVVGFQTCPDSSGLCFPDQIDNQITLTNPKGQMCMVMKPPTSVDIGFKIGFKVPKNYVGSPKLIITGILDGSPSNTLGLGFAKKAIADSESIDQAKDAEQTVTKSTWTGYADEDLIELAITLTAGDYTIDDFVEGYLYRDYSAESGSQYAGNLLVIEVEFEFTDA